MTDLKNRIQKSPAPATQVIQLVAECLRSAEVTHIYHFETTSFAAHKAFEDFYEIIPGLTDTLCEAYFGKYGRCEIPEPKLRKTIDPLIYCETLCSISESVACCPNIDNIIQEITTAIDSLIYKLKNLS